MKLVQNGVKGSEALSPKVALMVMVAAVSELRRCFSVHLGFAAELPGLRLSEDWLLDNW